MLIRYLPHTEIDLNRWDQCIEASVNRRSYAFSWYLNGVCRKSWDALVMGHYEAVMPLPWNRKWGLKYIYQPPFSQQLGLFSPHPHLLERSCDWLKYIPASFVRCDLQGNAGMVFPSECVGGFRSRTNYILNLHASLEALLNQMDARHRSRIRSLNPDLRALPLEAKAAVDFFSRYQGALDTNLKKEDYERMIQLIQRHPQHFLMLQAVLDSECLGVVVLLLESDRATLIMSSPSEEGRKWNTQLFLLHHLIGKWAETPMMLDFEGSDLPQVAHFYQKFGAINHPYPQWSFYPLFWKWRN